MQMRWLSLVLLLALPACAAKSVEDRRIENPAVPLSLSGLPAPLASDARVGLRDQYLGPLDRLSIEIFGISELSKEMQVGSDGRIDYPLIGEVAVAGLTPGELAGVIESRLRGRYVRDPHVTVNILDAVSQSFSIEGGVDGPGIYRAVGNMTLMRAVASAGGLSDTAKTEDVIVFRTVDGQDLAGLYNLEGIRVGNYADPPIYPGDKIVVNSGNDQFEQIFKGVQTLLPLVLLADRLTD